MSRDVRSSIVLVHFCIGSFPMIQQHLPRAALNWYCPRVRGSLKGGYTRGNWTTNCNQFLLQIRKCGRVPEPERRTREVRGSARQRFRLLSVFSRESKGFFVSMLRNVWTGPVCNAYLWLKDVYSKDPSFISLLNSNSLSHVCVMFHNFRSNQLYNFLKICRRHSGEIFVVARNFLKPHVSE